LADDGNSNKEIAAWLCLSAHTVDAEFSLIGTRRADAGLGWLTAGPEALPAPLDTMVLGVRA
jgi:hypothetical protein